MFTVVSLLHNDKCVCVGTLTQAHTHRVWGPQGTS